MNIVLFTKALHYSYLGGIQTHVWELSRQLVKHGHQVTVISAVRIGKPQKIFTDEGVRFISAPYIPGAAGFMHFYNLDENSFNYFASRELEKLMAKGEKIDIVHIQGRSGYLYLQRRNIRPPVVLATLHATVEEEMGDFVKDPKVSWKRRQELLMSYKNGLRIEDIIVNRGDHIITVSQKIKNILIDDLNTDSSKVTVIPNGLDVDKFTPAPEKRIPGRVLCVARLAPVKGVHHLVEAARLLSDVNNFSLHIVGDGEQWNYLQDQIKDLGQQDRVKLLGKKSGADLLHEYHQASLFVLPSYNEGQGIVYMEAMACEIPVISFNIPAVDEVIDNNIQGLMTPKGETEGLAAAMREILMNPEMVQKMGKAGRKKIIDQFQWKSIAKRTETLYEFLLG